MKKSGEALLVLLGIILFLLYRYALIILSVLVVFGITYLIVILINKQSNRKSSILKDEERDKHIIYKVEGNHPSHQQRYQWICPKETVMIHGYLLVKGGFYFGKQNEMTNLPVIDE